MFHRDMLNVTDGGLFGHDGNLIAAENWSIPYTVVIFIYFEKIGWHLQFKIIREIEYVCICVHFKDLKRLEWLATLCVQQYSFEIEP
jgi:hypothetical protein